MELDLLHEHMDIPRENKPHSVWQWSLVSALGVGTLVLVWHLFARSATTYLRVDPQRLTTALVERGDFLEFCPFEGTVQPIAVESGQHLEKGDLILRLSNATLQRTAIETETQLPYNLDIQCNTQFGRAASGMLRRETLLDLEHQIRDTESKFRRYDTLMTDANSPITAEQFETTRNQLQFLRAKRDPLCERIRQEDLLSTRQVTEVRKSIDRLNTSLDLLKRIGQIDLLDQSDESRFKVRTRIDQYYIGRVQLELSFGDPFQTLRVTQGAFLEQTAGHWGYLVSKDGKTAHRTAVGFGRHNPREVEVLEGLNAGDRIITSGYDTFNAVDELRFTSTLRISQSTT